MGIELPDYELIQRAIMAYDAADAPEENAPVEPSEAEAIDLADGEYSIDVNLAGGSGRASVSSPALLIVRDGRAYARLLWSSAYYDYMLIGGARYENLSTQGGSSTFEVPITVLDAPMSVIADTPAMVDPVEIQYQLTFYAESVGSRSQVPQEAARQVLVISLAATDDAALNADIARACRQRGSPVNVSSDRALCDFYFPGVAVAGDVVAGVTASGRDHRLARQMTRRVQALLEESAPLE